MAIFLLARLYKPHALFSFSSNGIFGHVRILLPYLLCLRPCAFPENSRMLFRLFGILLKQISVRGTLAVGTARVVRAEQIEVLLAQQAELLAQQVGLYPV